MVFLYIYALISFAVYRGIFSSDTGEYCTAMYECLITIVHRGLIISTFEVHSATVHERLPQYASDA